MQEHQGGSHVQWLEPVSDEQYRRQARLSSRALE